MERSTTITELAKALVSFQSEMKTVSFDKDNPFYKSKYATLSTLVETSKPILTKHHLAVSQLVEGEGNVVTILIHTSGEFLSSTATLRPVIKPVKDENGGKYMPSHPDPQSVGSAITYTRRYAYASILGLVSDEDDDGNAATHDAKPASKIKPTSDSSSQNGNGSHIPPPKTMLDMIKEQAKIKFENPDEFKTWRIDNNLPEKLEGLKDFDLIKTFNAVREYKTAPMKRG